MKPTVLDALKSAKARVIYLVLGVMGLFKFIGDFKVPGDRIGYLGTAFAYVWPDLLALLVLVLLAALRRWWYPPIARTIGAFWTRSRDHRRLAVSLSVVFLALATAGMHRRIATAYYQTASAVDSRLQVYTYAFGFRYSDSLRARAVEHLQAGRPETADQLLARAEKWTFNSPTLSEDLKELRALAKSRIELSSTFSKGLSRAQLSGLGYFSTASLDAAYVLNSESYGLRGLLTERNQRMRRFGKFLEPALLTCGTSVEAQEEATFGADCSLLAAEQFDAKVGNCQQMARLYCEQMPGFEDEDKRLMATRSFLASSLGIGEMAAILGDTDAVAAH